MTKKQPHRAISTKDLSTEDRKKVYAQAILNLRDLGLASEKTTIEMLERVKAAS